MSVLKQIFATKRGVKVREDVPIEKVKCTNCGAEILPSTAKKYKGLCAPCARSPDVARERALRRLSPKNLYYGWFSEEQARVAGTFIYLDKGGNEVEVSSVTNEARVSSKESEEIGYPGEFNDIKFVGMV